MSDEILLMKFVMRCPVGYSLGCDETNGLRDV